MDITTHACFFDLPVTEFDNLENKLKSYDIGHYAIAHETKPRDHFHLIWESTEQVSNNFRKVIVEKYKLRRKGRGGKVNYGKVKDLRDAERMLVYTLKDGNFRSNYDPEILHEYFKQSFKKEDRKHNLELLVEHLDNLEENLFEPKQSEIDFPDRNQQHFFKPQPKTIYIDQIIKKHIINFHLLNNLRISRLVIHSNFIHYLIHTVHLSQEQRVSNIYHYL